MTNQASPRGTKRYPFLRHRKQKRSDLPFFVIMSASEAISLLACRQIPQGMLGDAPPFGLRNSTACGQDSNGKTVTNYESSGSAFYGSLIGKAPMHPSPRGALIIPKEYWSRYNVIVFSPTVRVYSSTMLSGVSTDRTHS